MNKPTLKRPDSGSRLYTGFIFIKKNYIILLYLTLIVLSLISGSIIIANELAVPAEFSHELRVPGKFHQILRPSAIYFDHNLDECLVADPGNNRIVIFDKNGYFLFEFSGTSHFNFPADVAVDDDGLIWVLGSNQAGRHIFIYDFDGLFIRKIELPIEIDGYHTNISSFDLDADKNIYLIENNSFQILVYDSTGNFDTSFEILNDYNQEEREEEVIGQLRVQNNLILLPCGVSGIVYLYDLEGKLISGIGHKGSKIGALGFPVAAVMNNDSLILILDKSRQNVVCYDLSGKFKGEFGGKGINPGWFYYPTLLEFDNKNQVYIGQIFNNKIQVCRLPEFICPDNRSERVQ